MEDQACRACGSKAAFSILLVEGPEEGQLYIPNQIVREGAPDVIREVWFCHPCNRAIEDAMRSVVNSGGCSGGHDFVAAPSESAVIIFCKHCGHSKQIW